MTNSAANSDGKTFVTNFHCICVISSSVSSEVANSGAMSWAASGWVGKLKRKRRGDEKMGAQWSLGDFDDGKD